MKVKIVLAEILTLIQQVIMWIPFWPIRWLWLKFVLKKLGKGTYVSRNVDLRKPSNIILGNNCVVNKSVLLDGRGGILEISDNVDIAQECMLWTLTHDIDSPIHTIKHNDTYIKNNVWLCARCIILPGVTINAGAVIGAGSVIHKDVEALSVVAGNPGKIIKIRNNDLSFKLNYHKLFL